MRANRSRHGLKWHGKVLNYLRSQADPDGMIKLSVRAIGQATDCRVSSVCDALNLLVIKGDIERLTVGLGSRSANYRLTNPTISSVSTIESVTRQVSNRNYAGAHDSVPTVSISLPRVRFLERTIA